MTIELKSKKFHVKKGDVVEVISGNQRGKKGRILDILTKKDRAIVEGLNIITKHTKRSQTNPEGKLDKREGAIHISNLRVVESAQADKKPAKAEKAEKSEKKPAAKKKAAKE
jgi:large subunit ribosomal protein L24